MLYEYLIAQLHKMMKFHLKFLILIQMVVWCGSRSLTSTEDGSELYRVGVGKADVTGPPANVNMMGYADLSQNTAGIHTRLYSRAFIISQKNSTIVFVSVDTSVISQIVTTQVVKRLKQKYGSLYTEKNVCLSGTHTHSVPGGFLQYLLYVFTALGFKRSTFDALINGIVTSIERANDNIQDAKIYYNSGDLFDASINRSPTSYDLNPPEERKLYKSNVDNEMLLLKFTDKNDQPIGMLNWFPVHCTSMNKTNKLISGDNKGLASLLFEQYMDQSNLFGKSSFVAGFAQGNEGDISPNTNGAKCFHTGKSCDSITSSCNGNSEACIATGPGKDMFESTEIIARKQFIKAKELFESSKTLLKGSIKFSQKYIDMSNQTITNDLNGEVKKTCLPAMGYSFGAGTTDGPGFNTFHQGMTRHNVLLDFISGWLLEEPTEDQKNCHYPKPILLNTGQTTYPFAWQPAVVSTQVMKIGDLVILSVPGEFTTMSGRRLKKSILKSFNEITTNENKELKVVIAGLANTYSSYVTTYEEYQAQRYEAASTIFGPHTLEVYQKIYSDIFIKMMQDEEVKNEIDPPFLLQESEKYSMKENKYQFDEPPQNRTFGDVLQDTLFVYFPEMIVTVVFAASNPNSPRMFEKNFLTVERFNDDNNSWKIVATDEDWSTKFHWSNDCGLRCSSAKVEWKIPSNIQTGKYRIRYFGFSTNQSMVEQEFSGSSSHFMVSPISKVNDFIKLLHQK